LIIIGVNAYHGDSSACLFIDNKLICAVEEERLTRIKHHACFPEKAINECLLLGNIKPGDVDILAINSDPTAGLISRLKNKNFYFEFYKLIIPAIKRVIKKRGYGNSYIKQFRKVVNIEHHSSHAEYAYQASKFKNCISLTIDGFGDGVSTRASIYRSGKSENLFQVTYPHSLGIFYQALTQWLGFHSYGDEYKLMGLAAYGKPIYSELIGKIINKKKDGFSLSKAYFSHFHKKIDYTWNGKPHVGQLFTHELEELLGKKRKPEEELTSFHKDMAASIQKVYEDYLFHLVKSANKYAKGIYSIILSGGCAMNSLANGKVLKHTGLKNIYIPSSPGDGGGSIGAALIANKKFNPNYADNYFNISVANPYLGRSFSDDIISNTIESNKDYLLYKLLDEESLIDNVTDLLIAGMVGAWYQSGSEWGPRALGNRSIIADPRNSEIKQRINAKTKLREEFRPFAPSFLPEFVDDWFEEYLGGAEFMGSVYLVKKSKRNKIPAVVHADGTARLQVIDIQTNKKYYSLVESFYKKTKVPAIVNTSFNVDEPIVYSPEDAVSTFISSDLDFLALGNYLITKK